MLGMRLTIVCETRPYCGRGAGVLNDILVNENGLKEAVMPRLRATTTR
jgi:hypothetical protein